MQSEMMLMLPLPHRYSCPTLTHFLTNRRSQKHCSLACIYE